MDKKEVPLVHAKKTVEKDLVLDPNGFFVIEVRNNAIFVEYYKNVYKNNCIVSGNIKKVFKGQRADELCDTIADHVPDLLPGHYLYLGRELKIAEQALDRKIVYEQGGC